MLDSDLAELYGVPTKRLNEQVRRNAQRFPADFMFALDQAEWETLRSQFATLNAGRGQHRKYLPYAFTEHGAIMAATVLNSSRAVEVSIYVVVILSAVHLRERAATLARRCHLLRLQLPRHTHAWWGRMRFHVATQIRCRATEMRPRVALMLVAPRALAAWAKAQQALA